MSEESMFRKYKNKTISPKEYKEYIANQNGFKEYSDYSLSRLKKRGYSSVIEYRENLAKKKGFNNYTDECNQQAQKMGFLNYNKLNLYRRHNSGKSLQLSDNKQCSNFLGVYIAERLLSKVFENVQRMPYGNKGYDFICNKGYKIDVKSACLNSNNVWLFGIKKNKVPEYFLFLAFDNRKDLTPNHIWLIKGTEIIKTTKVNTILNNRVSLCISNSVKILNNYIIYEKSDKLEKLVECCNTIKGDDNE